jgi:hypothetical protein
MQPSDLESELRAALAAKAGRASVSPDAWGQVQRRIRRQRLGRAGTIALALGLLLVAVLAVPLARTLLPGFTPDPAPPATAPPAPPPATTAGPIEATRPTGTTSLRPVRGERVDDPGAAVRALGRQPRGEPVDAIAWTDRLGDNLLILTKQETTGESELFPGEQAVSVTLYAELLTTSGGRTRLVRTVTDGTRDCTFDQETFWGTTPMVSDLDNDQVGEVLFSYTLGCRSDVSAVDLKLLVLEGQDKYIVRGKTYVTEARGMPQLADGVPEPAYEQWPAPLAELARQRYAERAARGGTG